MGTVEHEFDLQPKTNPRVFLEPGLDTPGSHIETKKGPGHSRETNVRMTHAVWNQRRRGRKMAEPERRSVSSALEGLEPYTPKIQLFISLFAQ